MIGSRTLVRTVSYVVAGLSGVSALAAPPTATHPMLKALLAAYSPPPGCAANAQLPTSASREPSPEAVFGAAMLAFAEGNGTLEDNIVAIDWVTEHPANAWLDPVGAASLVERGLALLQKMDTKEPLVRESIAFAGSQIGHLLYLGVVMPTFRSHDAPMNDVRDAGRLSRARAAFAAAAEADPQGRYGRLARDFLDEIDFQRPGCRPKDVLGADDAGNELRVSSLRGKVVVVKFFAYFYGTAGDQFAAEREIVRVFDDNQVVVLLVNLPAPGVARVTRLTSSTQDLASLSGESKIPCEWTIRGFPQTYVINTDGTIQGQLPDWSADKLKKLVQDALDRAARGDGC